MADDSSQRAERAERLGFVTGEEYLSPEEEAEALGPGAVGFPDAWLERVRDRPLM